LSTAAPSPHRSIAGRQAWLVIGTLGALVVLGVPALGSDPWPFRPGHVHPSGIFAAAVRAAHERWDLGILRTPAVLGGVLVVALAVWLLASGRLPVRLAVAGTVVVCVLLLLPGVILQAGLRQSTAPWFYTNDSTYQIELAGQLVRDGHDPYGHDYGSSGLERFYSLDGAMPAPSAERQVALSHFAYFPGTALAAAAWGLLPKPLDDYRFLVALCALALLPAALLFPGPLGLRLAVGAGLAAGPLITRAAWFGTADAPSLLLLVVAFGLASRSRWTWAAASLGGAILLKQFALVALPFFVILLLRRAGRDRLAAPAVAFCAVLLAGFLPFLIADPGALWRDTVTYGAGTYRIIGYGLAALLLRAHALGSRTGSYPFVPLALAVWAPVTAWLLRVQWRSQAAWTGAVAFTASMFLLLFIARVFQTSYLVWPLVGVALALLLAGAERGAAEPTLSA
jgi:Glycosyltransferase family 87